MDNIKNTIVAVVSCEKYKQIWNPFFILFKKYWKDCPYKIFFISNGELPNFENIINFNLQKDFGWCTNLSKFINNNHFERVILFQEDFLLTNEVNTELVNFFVNYAYENDIGCLRLCPCPGPDKKWKDDFIGEISLNAEYRVSLQLSIWKKNILLELLNKVNSSAWDFEFYGKEFSKSIKEPFLSIYRESEFFPGGPIKYFITAITRGIWENGALELLKKENISL